MSSCVHAMPSFYCAMVFLSLRHAHPSFPQRTKRNMRALICPHIVYVYLHRRNGIWIGTTGLGMDAPEKILEIGSINKRKQIVDRRKVAKETSLLRDLPFLSTLPFICLCTGYFFLFSLICWLFSKWLCLFRIQELLP